MENNVQKMREALEIAKEAICHHARKNHTCDSLAWWNSTINANCGDILCGHRDLCEAKTAIQKALATLPRNCDRFPDEAEARKAFIVWYNTVYELYGDNWNEISSCDLKHDVDGILHDYIEWLFAPTDDRKGESD